MAEFIFDLPEIKPKEEKLEEKEPIERFDMPVYVSPEMCQAKPADIASGIRQSCCVVDAYGMSLMDQIRQAQSTCVMDTRSILDDQLRQAHNQACCAITNYTQNN